MHLLVVNVIWAIITYEILYLISFTYMNSLEYSGS